MAITKEASNSNHNVLPVRYKPSAREAFRQIIQQINFKENEFLLLPAYIGITDKEGSGVFDPVRASGVKYDFYKINEKLELDYSDIVKKVKEKKIKAILVIHYFSFFQVDIVKLKQLCDAENIALIEDCAHAMNAYVESHKMIGSVGHYAFYSIHKYLPTKDGGFYTYTGTVTQGQDGSNGEEISHETLYIAHTADYNAIKTRRIANYNMMLSLLKSPGKKYSILHSNVPEGVVPLNFPVLIHNQNREKVYFKLIDKGVTVMSLYYRLIEQIDRASFPLSYHISNSMLNFPIHQDIETKDIEYMSKVFLSVIDEME
jgi:dTDP-4-amino-4,6-dideoxygalactose transaminase